MIILQMIVTEKREKVYVYTYIVLIQIIDVYT